MKKILFVLVMTVALLIVTPSAKADSVTLAWDAVVATDLAGYNIYWCDALGVKPKVKLLSVGIVTTGTVQTPAVVGDGEYELRITSVDAATPPNESALSEPAVNAAGVVVKWTDKTPPPVPTKLRVP